MSASILPGYSSFLEELEVKIKSAQIKAALTVNAQMLALYWDLGKAIVEKSTQAGWGNAVVEQLSKDLIQDFPTLKGFSRTNLYAMRSWYLFYGQQDPIVPQVVGQIPWGQNRLIYLSALDSQVKSMEDKPSIGMILCRSNQKKVTAEYALRDMNKPIGIAEYRLTEAIPENLRTQLPTIEELEEELKKGTQGNS